jgi:glycosyltransferase involved in cell wall biosynthesis
LALFAPWTLPGYDFQVNGRASRVAIVSDPLVQRGGAERVVQTLAEIFPDAPVFAILYSPERGPSALAPRVRESWLRRIPAAARRHRALLPLFPAAVESFDLSTFDVIISSHHTAAKGFIRDANQLHICYCHTPMRALWERPHDEIATLPPIARPAARALFSRLRTWDYVAAGRVDCFIANSRTTQARIAKHYGRPSEIVYPPIDTERFTPGGSVGDYYLIVSRPVPYKRIDVALCAAARLGRRVVLAGGGNVPPGMTGANVEVVGRVSDHQLVRLMRGARALLFPQLEDFGMTALEMNACGRPVIAYGAGGALETVVSGRTGVFAAAQTPAAFAAAIETFESIEAGFDPLRIRRHAEQFSGERFVRELLSVVARAQGGRADELAAPRRASLRVTAD